MTGIVKHAENAVKARRELAAVKQEASEVIRELLALVKAMYLFGDLEKLRMDGKPISEIVPDLLAANTAAEMLTAMRPNTQS